MRKWKEVQKVLRKVTRLPSTIYVSIMKKGEGLREKGIGRHCD